MHMATNSLSLTGLNCFVSKTELKASVLDSWATLPLSSLCVPERVWESLHGYASLPENVLEPQWLRNYVVTNLGQVLTHHPNPAAGWVTRQSTEGLTCFNAEDIPEAFKD